MHSAFDSTSWLSPHLRESLRDKCVRDLEQWIAAQFEVARKGESAPAPLHLKALIDAGQLFGTELELESELEKAYLPFARLYDGTPDREHAEVGGWLVDLSCLDGQTRRNALTVLCQTMEYGWTMTVFTTRMDSSKLLAYLNHFRRAQLPDEGDVLFAFFDPRVLMRLIQHAPDIVGQIARPMHAWAYWDRQLKLQTICGGDDLQPAQPAFAFSADLVEKMEGEPHTDQVRSLILEKGEIELGEFAPHLQFHILDHFYQKALDVGLTTRDGKITYCQSCLQRTPTLEQIPSIKEALAKAEGRDDEFMKQVKLVEDAFWEEQRPLRDQHLQAWRKRFAELLGVS